MNNLKELINKTFYVYIEDIFDIPNTKATYKALYPTAGIWVYHYKKSQQYNDLAQELKLYHIKLASLTKSVIKNIIDKYADHIPEIYITQFQQVGFLFKENIISSDDATKIIKEEIKILKL
jgi:hypothetical protein